MVRRTSKKNKETIIESIMRKVDEFNKKEFDIMDHTPPNHPLSAWYESDWYESAVDPIEDIKEAMEGLPEPCPPGLFIFGRRITGHCSMCNQVLTNDFPEDFPDEFKFCCGCKSYAEDLLIGRVAGVDILLKKILKRMTLYDGRQ